MKNHEIIYLKTKELLLEHIPERIEEHENGWHIVDLDSGFWLSSDDRELTIGYGFSHIHVDPEYDDLSKAIDVLFNLITCKKRISNYCKGNICYRAQVDLILENEEVYNLGKSATLIFPFWRKTICKTEMEDELINIELIKDAMVEIKQLAR